MIGTVINGNWQVTRQLGEGGMGAVYEIVHVHLGIRRAMKTLLRQWSNNPQLLQRFFHEAKATAALNHKNIIGIHDYGALPDGTQYIMMDFLEGSTLGSVLRLEGRLPLDRTLRILTQIALALTAAHERGIVHRDLKPENVFLTTRDGEPDHVVLLDFGIAKLMETRGSMTHTHAVIGTPTYMPPEQLRGAKDVDHRVDIFALGVIGYVAVTGRMPFQKSEPLHEYFELSAVELHERQMRDGPTDPRAYVPSLPDDWAIGLLGALHRDRTKRPRLDELVVLFKRSTPNGHEIVERCARDLLKQAALGETMRASSTPMPSAPVTVPLGPSSGARSPGAPVASPPLMATPVGPPQAAPPVSPPVVAPPVREAPVSAAPGALAPTWSPPASGPETPVMTPRRVEPVPMLAIGGPASQSTLSGAASQALPTSRPAKRWLVPVLGLGVAAAVTGGALVTLRGGDGAEREPAPATTSTVVVDAATTASASDAAVPQDASSVEMAAASPDAAMPIRDAGAEHAGDASVTSRVVTRGEPKPSPPSATTKRAVKPPREMGEIRVFVETTYAEVYVDGKKVASTPWAGKLPVGRHTITLHNPDTGRRETHKVTISATNPTIIERPW